MNKLKKPLCLAITVMVFTMLFFGCGKQQKEASNDVKSEKSQAEEVVTGLPIVDKSITLKYWAPMNPQAVSYIRSYSENEVYQEIEKRTGIHIDFMHPALGQENEQFNLMMASGDLPDIILGAGRYKGGVAKGVDDGVFLNLTPYIPKYAPDYNKIINSNPEVKRQILTDAGVIPAFFIIKLNNDTPFRRLNTRKDWLADVNMEVPKTIEQWDTYFKKLKEVKNVQVPLIMKQADGVEELFLGAYGIRAGFYMKDPKTGAYGQIQPEFKEYLTLMNNWFSKGYISKDFPSLKDLQMQASFTSGQGGTLPMSVDALNVAAQAVGIEIMPAPFPRLKEGDKLHWYSPGGPVNGQETVINKDCKYPTEAIRWLNYAYTEEGSTLYNFGIKDKTYTIVDGKPKYTDYMLKNPKFPTEAAMYILKVHFAPKLQGIDTECNPSVVSNEKSLALRKMWSDDKNMDGALFLPPVKLTLDESTARSRIMTDINSYTSEMILKFILGIEPLSRYDTYVSKVKELGINDAVKITQDAYDRYMSIK